ncbi:glycerophosphoryl diester phosphodiesterase [Sphingomonas sp. 37zxx]|uniref:glycerophosphoryl diester phosphodiesterase n=1 Tax=Sphingomonas sp. 37zxx TaxID=1550073 RepID=UPI000ACA2903|nr:glycerophosphoryl diester phosphodiesterase [Sphingomonas sp. 37zxx]
MQTQTQGYAQKSPALRSSAVEINFEHDGSAVRSIVRVHDKAGTRAIAPADGSALFGMTFSAGPPDPKVLPINAKGQTFREAYPELVFDEVYDSKGDDWIEKMWERSFVPISNAVTFDKAGDYTQPTATAVRSMGDGVLISQKSDRASIEAAWRIDPSFPTDIIVDVTATVHQSGYYSFSSPQLLSVDPSQLAWATTPGYFQGRAINSDIAQSMIYGQGVPDRSILARERTLSAPASILDLKSGLSIATIAAPGLAQDPMEDNGKARTRSRMAMSHMTREGALFPILHHPVLGEEGSKRAAGETITFSMRYSLAKRSWFETYKHIARDIYASLTYLDIAKPETSLTERVRRQLVYLSDPKASRWVVAKSEGREIGAQEYNGWVPYKDNDAIKTSDLGAMWLSGTRSSIGDFGKTRLPYVRNLKIVQQDRKPGFTHGASRGQYYLTKSDRFVEESGKLIEPIATSYYTAMDIGTILLFEPGDKELREALRLAAERLLKWQRSDGSWAVAYMEGSHEERYKFVKDLRPTFYGLLVAYKVLGDDRYLKAARKGADWLVREAVENGHFLGVCGDVAHVNDFATAQIGQAMLEMYDITGDARYKAAAIETARIYTMSIYTWPTPSAKPMAFRGADIPAWTKTQFGLGFEHGGHRGSARWSGPILLSTYAGFFVRIHELTKDPFFLELARSAAIGRDGFVDDATSVASYYWATFDAGAGPFPHHAWWQIGWIVDYLMSEVELRSSGGIKFPKGFMTPKVGPTLSYGFKPGTVFGHKAQLSLGEPAFAIADAAIDQIVMKAVEGDDQFVVLLNDSAAPRKLRLPGATTQADVLSATGVSQQQVAAGLPINIDIESFGMRVIRLSNAANKALR